MCATTRADRTRGGSRFDDLCCVWAADFVVLSATQLHKFRVVFEHSSVKFVPISAGEQDTEPIPVCPPGSRTPISLEPEDVRACSTTMAHELAGVVPVLLPAGVIFNVLSHSRL